MSLNASGLPSVYDDLCFAGKLGGMMFLGLFGFAALGALAESDALPLDDDFEEAARATFHFAPRVPRLYPLMPSPYLGTLAGMCRGCGSGDIVVLPSPFLSSSTRAWYHGMSAYEGFGWEARRSQQARLQAMADGELFDLMEGIVQESRRRRSARSDSGCQ
ncbi:hypothetical protein PV10_00788 [Exophiala mesophila]|uniref:Uncharacterized protein n=1 Tax=Exophiala mesophila TaxID=212818 RepID=A0A0D2ADL9_EXOME|nr:uncharacterized protein PV10_00788 [Exophiala mesophila]KIV96978.1 hypothetical protein PV10_00788 [Exophiala mesophila]